MGDHSTMTGFGGGTYGPTAYWTASTNTWSNGTWDDNGAAITPDACNNTSGHSLPIRTGIAVTLTTNKGKSGGRWIGTWQAPVGLTP